MDFEFRTVPLIINRFGASGALGELLTAQFAPRRVLVVSDPGVVAAGLLRQPLASLEAAGIEAAVFAQGVADPPEAGVLAAAQRAGALGAQVIVGLGGGSSLDVAKLAAVLAQGD
ncbi:MAG: iron-containing alcohol dehydrogenase, partial [Candidatus Competibacterales bacterium]